MYIHTCIYFYTCTNIYIYWCVKAWNLQNSAKTAKCPPPNHAICYAQVSRPDFLQFPYSWQGVALCISSMSMLTVRGEVWLPSSLNVLIIHIINAFPQSPLMLPPSSDSFAELQCLNSGPPPFSTKCGKHPCTTCFEHRKSTNLTIPCSHFLALPPHPSAVYFLEARLCQLSRNLLANPSFCRRLDPPLFMKGKVLRTKIHMTNADCPWGYPCSEKLYLKTAKYTREMDAFLPMSL